MKKLLFFAAFFAIIFACNSGDQGAADSSTTDNKDTPATSSTDRTQSPIYQKGIELEAASDCKTCHNIDTRLQGPSYEEIANKYASMPDTIMGHLAGKIIEGGSGVWDIPIQMNPHPTMPKEDAEALVRYIFLFKK